MEGRKYLFEHSVYKLSVGKCRGGGVGGGNGQHCYLLQGYATVCTLVMLLITLRACIHDSGWVVQ